MTVELQPNGERRACRRELESTQCMSMVLVRPKADSRKGVELATRRIPVLFKSCRITRIARTDPLNSRTQVYSRQRSRFRRNPNRGQVANRALFPQKSNSKLNPRMRGIPKERLSGGQRGGCVDRVEKPFFV